MATKRSSVKTAASGEAQTVKKPRSQKKRPARKQSRKPRNPLAENPAPDLWTGTKRRNAQQRESLYPPGVQSLFQPQNSQAQETSQQPEAEAPASHGINDSSSGEPANRDAQRRLDSIPDVIGVDPDAPEQAAAAEPSITSDEVTALMALVTFEEQDVKDTLCELFDWIAERMQSDHWKLTERQARMLGGPTTQLINSLWGKLMQRLPDVIVAWCERTPGAAAFLLSFGLVVVPKGMKQIAVSRERRAVKAEVKSPEPAKHREAKQEPNGFGGIPAARGIVQGSA